MPKLGELLTKDDFQVFADMETSDGQRYRVVQLSAWSAAVIVEGMDNLSITLISDGNGVDGGIQVIEKGVIDTVIDWGKEAFKFGIGLITGQCKIENTQTATFDKESGNMTGFTNTTRFVCKS